MNECPDPAETPPNSSTGDRTTRAKIARQASQLQKEIVRLCEARAACLRELDDREQVRAILKSLPSGPARRTTQSNPLQLESVFRELDSATLALWGTTRVAYLGPEFSYSHLAASYRFGQSAELCPTLDIRGVFEAVRRGDAEYGLVPIENSTDGRIVDTLDMFVREPLKICGEVPLRIHHCLLARNASLADIREVHSKPQALSQCRNWLSQHLPKAQLVSASSTTAAAEMAAQTPGIAAIASRQAGINYQLDVVMPNIEDNPDNVTRFAVLGTTLPKRTGRDKSSLMFELPHEPGSLAEALMIFKRNRLNLTWIESFPKKGSPNEYIFFAELEGHLSEIAMRRAVKAIAKKAVRVEQLGSYPRAPIAE